MEGPRLLRISKKLGERFELQAERLATIVVATATIVAVGYTLLWWIAIAITSFGNSIVAFLCFLVMALLCVAIITPVGSIIGIFDIIENFVPFNKDDIPTGDLTAMLAGPLLSSLAPFLWAWFIGTENTAEFFGGSAIVFVLCLAGGFKGASTKKSAAKTSGKKGKGD